VPFHPVIGLPIKIAVATSLMTVIATSSVVSVSTVGRNLINLRLGMLLEVASAAGGVAAGLMFHALSDETLFLWFAFVTGVIAVMVLSRLDRRNVLDASVDPGRLGGRYYEDESGREVVYQVKRLPVALGVSALAGVVSGSLGIGGGILKVPLLNAWCGVPLRAAAATSALMIGVTAAARPIDMPTTIFSRRSRCSARRALARDSAYGLAAARRDLALRGHPRAHDCPLASAGPAVVLRARTARRALRRRRGGEHSILAAGLATSWRDAPAANRLLDAGLLVLMATPMRVLLSVVEFVRIGDWFFAGDTGGHRGAGDDVGAPAEMAAESLDLTYEV
jgi:hypothetical protein